jgi:hypothetical protein
MRDGITAIERIRNSAVVYFNAEKYSFTPGPNLVYSYTPKKVKGSEVSECRFW